MSAEPVVRPTVRCACLGGTLLTPHVTTSDRQTECTSRWANDHIPSFLFFFFFWSNDEVLSRHRPPGNNQLAQFKNFEKVYYLCNSSGFQYFKKYHVCEKWHASKIHRLTLTLLSATKWTASSYSCQHIAAVSWVKQNMITFPLTSTVWRQGLHTIIVNIIIY